MAVNAIGLNIQLLTGSQGALNAQNVLGGLKAGDLLQARVLEILPDQKAIITVLGQNLLAQLPEPQAGQPAIQQGSVLDLMVTAAKNPAGQSQAPGSSPTALQNSPISTSNQQAPAPALTLKLMGLASQPAKAAAMPSLTPEGSPAPRPSLENALAQARLPLTPSNFKAAESLSRYGLPLDPPTLQSVVREALSLVAVQEPLPAPATPQPASAPAPAGPGAEGKPVAMEVQNPSISLPGPARQVLLDAKTMLEFVASQPTRAAERPMVQAALRQVQDLLDGKPVALPARAGEAMIAETRSLPEWTATVDQALNALSDGKSNALPKLNLALARPIPLEGAPLAPQPAAAEPSAPQVQSQAATKFAQAAGSEPAPLPQFVAAREVTAWLTQKLNPQLRGASVSHADIQETLAGLATALESPSSPEARILGEAVLRQLPPEIAAKQTPQAALKSALLGIQDAFQAKPLPAPVGSPTELAAALEQRGLPTPAVNLAALPMENVIEAVVFLRARQIPVTRAAVEAVASQLGEGPGLSEPLTHLSQAPAALPQEILNARPALKQALGELASFMRDHGVQPDRPDLAGQIRQFVARVGMDFESALAARAAAPSENARTPLATPGPAVPAPPEQSLKAVLLRVAHEARQASLDPASRSSKELGGQLESIARDAQSAVNSISTLQMAARPTPAFEVSSFPLPVMIGGQLQSGQLSVFWRKGKAHELSADEPVNVVVMLSTRALGDVKVQMQVWKEACRCKVSVAGVETRDFLASNGPSFKQGFESNTPFRLETLDFSTLSQNLAQALDSLDPAVPRPDSSLNISA